MFDKMPGLKFLDRHKSIQVYALNAPPDANPVPNGASPCGKLIRCRRRRRQDPEDAQNDPITRIKREEADPVPSLSDALLPYGLPAPDSMEPPIEPILRPANLVETLADLHCRLQVCPSDDKTQLYLEQYAVFCSLNDPKLLRRCLQSARRHAADAHSKVVLSAWLRYERREDELEGSTTMACSGDVFECPKAALVPGYDPNSVDEKCPCGRSYPQGSHLDTPMEDGVLTSEKDCDVCFSVGAEEIHCCRSKIAALSSPFKAMLYGGFAESRRGRIDFSETGVSVKGMRSLEIYSRTRNLDLFCPEIIMELLSVANMFCCEELKSSCDAHLASLVHNVDEALVLIDYGTEQRANLIVASCLQMLLRELPSTLYNPNAMEFFCSCEAKVRLANAGHASFALYYFLSQVVMEENMTLGTTIRVLERLGECASERWQKTLSLHQLGCVMLKVKDYEGAQRCFDAAAEAGHVYSVAGVARSRYKQGNWYSACKLMNSLVSKHKSVGWMYQERSLYIAGSEKILDLNTASELDPTLAFPYKYRAVVLAQDKEIEEAILEIDKIISFKASADCLELRAWFFIATEDYESALRDIRALLALEPGYMMFHGKLSANYLVELLSPTVQCWDQADCWMQLYNHWSSVDDIGSLAVIHQMLENNPSNSLLRFRQSLLLLRLNCQKAAMHSLRLAQNSCSTKHERLIYEGWILYDTGHREAALCKADESICIQRSFEAFFLKAYVLADTSLDSETSLYVISLLEEALKCPSDGLRKGQALNNLGSIYVDCDKLESATDCYKSALDIKHTRAHQGLARVYFLREQRKDAYDEMTHLIEKSKNIASAYEKRSEYCDREMAMADLLMATKLDPTRTYPHRYRAAVLMDDQKEAEAVEELTKAIAFRPDVQMLHLRAAFHESMGNVRSALQDCEAALCLDPHHKETLDLHKQAQASLQLNT